MATLQQYYALGGDDNNNNTPQWRVLYSNVSSTNRIRFTVVHRRTRRRRRRNFRRNGRRATTVHEERPDDGRLVRQGQTARGDPAASDLVGNVRVGRRATAGTAAGPASRKAAGVRATRLIRVRRRRRAVRAPRPGHRRRHVRLRVVPRTRYFHLATAHRDRVVVVVSFPFGGRCTIRHGRH